MNWKFKLFLLESRNKTFLFRIPVLLGNSKQYCRNKHRPLKWKQVWAVYSEFAIARESATVESKMKSLMSSSSFMSSGDESNREAKTSYLWNQHHLRTNSQLITSRKQRRSAKSQDWLNPFIMGDFWSKVSDFLDTDSFTSDHIKKTAATESSEPVQLNCVQYRDPTLLQHNT